MSDIKVKDALLNGVTPIFPVTADLLRRAQDATACTNGTKLEEIAKKVSGFVRKTRPTTSDGYTWFWGLTFKRGKSKIAILFPWAFDFDAVDGNKDDRAIAVYVLEGKWNTDMASIIMELREKMYELSNQTPDA